VHQALAAQGCFSTFWVARGELALAQCDALSGERAQIHAGLIPRGVGAAGRKEHGIADESAGRISQARTKLMKAGWALRGFQYDHDRMKVFPARINFPDG